jgi:hypothetical protein
MGAGPRPSAAHLLNVDVEIWSHALVAVGERRSSGEEETVLRGGGCMKKSPKKG